MIPVCELRVETSRNVHPARRSEIPDLQVYSHCTSFRLMKSDIKAVETNLMERDNTSTLPKLPRVAITYCTQCKWMLRAAWMGQELLSTFGTSIGEIALIPATGGLFTVKLYYLAETTQQTMDGRLSEVLIWDRKRDGGFPEAKILKQLIRNHIDPEKSLGHSDTPSSKPKQPYQSEQKGIEGGENPSEEAVDIKIDPVKQETTCRDCN
jgi:selT/selW/selH-like putative selenoprotein